MVTTLALAKAGDGQAFRDLTEPYRRELQVHCYRILGSVHDAEDVVQDTLLAAWRGLDRFEERSSVRAWLYKIATNRCLNVLRSSSRRPQPTSAWPTSHDNPPPASPPEPVWLEPYPDAALAELPDAAPGPEARYEAREALGLAFVAGLQQLPPRQRAVLVLRDVLGFRAAEAADLLDSTETSVNSALQRARATLQTQLPANLDRALLPQSLRQRAVISRFVDAFESADIDRLVAVLADDAWLTMPPQPMRYQGPAAIAKFYLSLGWWGTKDVRLVPTAANGQPALGYYLRDPAEPLAHLHGLLVIEADGDAITRMTRFGKANLAPAFGLAPTLPWTRTSSRTSD